MQQKNIILAMIASFVILIGGAIMFSSSDGAGSNEGVVLAEKVKGNPESEVTLVEYSDFQCPACASFTPAIAELMEEHGDKLRFEYKHFPLMQIHPNALSAAYATEAAGVQGKFWEMHDLIFERQSSWSGSINVKSIFADYAEELGLDVDQFNRQFSSSIIKDEVRANLREGQGLDITGTPSFFLNGEKMSFGTYEEFITQIEVALGVTEEAAPAAAAPEVEFAL